MDLLITYDVNTLTPEGRSRLRRVAKVCEGFGQRVQESVFEVSVNETQRERLQAKLFAIIAEREDSLRIYLLRGGREGAITCRGLDCYIDFRDPLIL